MLTEEDLAMIAKLLDERGLTKLPSANAVRQQRYRQRNKSVTEQITKTLRPTREKRNKSVTAENTKRNGNTSPVVAMIPLANRTEWGVHQDYLTELETAYPAVDGVATLKEIRAWCISNPTKCKTERGVSRFINSWFAKDQNRG